MFYFLHKNSIIHNIQVIKWSKNTYCCFSALSTKINKLMDAEHFSHRNVFENQLNGVHSKDTSFLLTPTILVLWAEKITFKLKSIQFSSVQNGWMQNTFLLGMCLRISRLVYTVKIHIFLHLLWSILKIPTTSLWPKEDSVYLPQCIVSIEIFCTGDHVDCYSWNTNLIWRSHPNLAP